MPDYEELRLRVTLQDEASAQLARLRTELSQLGAGPQAQGFERLRTQNVQLTQLMRPVAQGTVSVRQGLSLMTGTFGVVGAAVAALGYAFYNQVQKLKEFSTQITNLNAQAQALGVSGAQFNNIKRQLEGMGISGQRAEGFISSFTRSMADLMREGSQLRQQLMTSTRDPEAMRAWIGRMTGAASQGDIEGAMNVFAEGVNTAFANELERTGSRIMAADLIANMMKGFNVDPETFAKISGQLTALTEEDKRAWEARYQAARQYEQEYNRLAGQLRGFWTGLNTELVSAFSQLFAELGVAEGTFEGWGRTVGEFIARDIQNLTSAIQLVKQLVDWINSLKDKTAGEMLQDIGGALKGQLPSLAGAGGQPATSFGDWARGRGEYFGEKFGNLRTGLGQLFGGGGGQATDYDAVIQEMIGNTDVVETQVDQMRDLADEFRELNDQLESRGGGGGVGAAEARALGGSVYSGRQYVVGERGPELFLKRQEGGPVEGGESYLVGERGPETFVPSQSGTIIPNTAQKGGLAEGLGGAAPLAAYGASLLLSGKIPGLSSVTHATMRGINLQEQGLGGVLRGLIPGIGGLEAIKRDAAGGHELRTQLRSLLGIEDPGEPAPWQSQEEQGGGFFGLFGSAAAGAAGAQGAAGAVGAVGAGGGAGGGGDMMANIFAPQENIFAEGSNRATINFGDQDIMFDAAGTLDAERRSMDRDMGGEITSRVEGEGTVNIDVGGGNGGRQSVHHLFKRTPINRQSQMEQAEAGPITAGSSISEATSG